MVPAQEGNLDEGARGPQAGIESTQFVRRRSVSDAPDPKPTSPLERGAQRAGCVVFPVSGIRNPVSQIRYAEIRNPRFAIPNSLRSLHPAFGVRVPCH